MPKSKTRRSRPAAKSNLRDTRPAARPTRALRQMAQHKSRSQPTGGRPPRFPGRTGGR